MKKTIISPNVLEAMQETVEANTEEIEDIESGLAIIVDGDTAPKAITSGQYLFIKNHSTLTNGGYHAKAAIASGATISTSNVEADADGIANALNSKLGTIETNVGEAFKVKNLTIATGNHTVTGLSNGDIIAFTRNGNGFGILNGSAGFTWIQALNAISNASYSNGTFTFTRDSPYSGEIVVYHQGAITIS